MWLPVQAACTRGTPSTQAAQQSVDGEIEVRPSGAVRPAYTAEQNRAEAERAKANNESVGSGTNDGRLHRTIVAKLGIDLETVGLNMNVDVDDGIVTLRGMVDFVQQKQDAERIVKETDGVQAVVNKLRVSKRWRIQHDRARRKADQPAADLQEFHE